MLVICKDGQRVSVFGYCCVLGAVAIRPFDCVSGRLMVERSRKGACEDRHGFCEKIDELVRVYHSSSGGGLKLGESRVGEFLSKLMQAACTYRVELDPRMASVSI